MSRRHVVLLIALAVNSTIAVLLDGDARTVAAIGVAAALIGLAAAPAGSKSEEN